MAAYTRTEDADYITFTRADGAAGYKISKAHPHFHAEEWMPWAETNAEQGRTHADIDAWYRRALELAGHTVTG